MKDETLAVRVESEVDEHGDLMPRRFAIGTRTIEVQEVVDRWLAPEYGYFKVQGDDEGIYILRHDRSTGRWELTLYDARGLK